MNRIGEYFLQLGPEGQSRSMNDAAQPFTSERPFHLFLEKEMNMEKKAKSFFDDLQIGNDSEQNQFKKAIKSLIGFTEEEWEGLLGSKSLRQKLPELAEWQSEAEEIMQIEDQEPMMEPLIHSFLSIIGFSTPDSPANLNAIIQTLQHSDYSDDAKHLFFRLINALESEHRTPNDENEEVNASNVTDKRIGTSHLPEKENEQTKLLETVQFLLHFTEEDWEAILGTERFNQMLPALREWQSEAEEMIRAKDREPMMERFIQSFLTIAGFTLPANLADSRSTVELGRYHDDAKTLFLRLANFLEANRETVQRSDRTHFENAILRSNHFVASAVSEGSEFNNRSHMKTEKATEPRIILQPGHFFQQASMDKLQQLEWRMHVTNRMNESSLANQLERLMGNSRLHTFKNGITELSIRLYPEHLGSLAIKLIHQNGELIARITAQTETAKQLIESQLHQLRHAFIAQQINVEKIEIGQQSHHSQQQAQHEGSRQGNGRNAEQEMEQTNDYENQQKEEEEESFKKWLEALSF
ncbi:hypothetical protein DCC39_01040 [Pueribacillus theae]|uniref:Flagellar hook-length control protein-like C-terminal domain-containing protein n=1 Tax=Pueribacillus theae TaxID=2171751 RepID=A0A2U1K7K8_9BACI|nr:flagellar hook-length control protein FliK [Pueribacillus theae]PWA13507.1 hypothetical protein DCC39_01040 [Pueribacillus theae]